jgi:hypothetical protein
MLTLLFSSSWASLEVNRLAGMVSGPAEGLSDEAMRLSRLGISLLGFPDIILRSVPMADAV